MVIGCPECNKNIVLAPKEQPSRIMRGRCACNIVVEITYPYLVTDGGW